jgi:TolA-binding protein
MSPDLHPEELLDKSAAGTLSETEAQWLEQHLASCAPCRFEQKARADFAALSVTASVDVESLVSRALAGAPAQAQAFAPRRGRRVPVLMAAAVAMFTVAGFAAVGQLTGVLPVIVERLVAPPPEPPKPQPVEMHKVMQPQPVVAPAVEPEPEQTKPPPPPAPAPVRHVVAQRPAPPPAPIVVAHDDAPALFLRGNAARVRGDRAEAALSYRELLARYPGSDEARLTHATLGRMLLDGGDARGALEQLDAYLAGGDSALREESMMARAMALSLLGRTGDEAAAWAALLESYPDSAHASRARARLDDLKAP